HGGRRGHSDGPAPVHHLERHRCGALGRQHHAAGLLPRRRVPRSRRADRQAHHHHPGVLAASGRVGVVAAQAHFGPRGRGQRPRRSPGPRHRRSGRL
ncbi:MAG: DedA protein, partial [uncultured Nocardioides sp.]